MNTVWSIAAELDAIQASQEVELVQIEGYGRQVVKARIYISDGLFVQVYRSGDSGWKADLRTGRTR